MARLNDEGEPDSAIYASDYILSPQPRAPPSKEHLLASFETSHLPIENGSTIDDSQMCTQDYEYSSSSSSARHSTSDIFGREIDDELEQMKSRASSRSSLSSVPASVLIHPKPMSAMSLHDRIAGYDLEEDEESFGGFEGPPKSIRTIRQREGAFRKPSSVRAMQMHTEDEADEDDYLTPPRRRGGMRSPGSSSLKRSPYYSPSSSHSKLRPKVQKEYPLVLLHCNLLAPSLPVPGAALPQNQKLLEEVLPPEYWKRWRRLQDKVGSGVLRDRGVLISHPEDLYDMLEERLLESLELQRSRLHQGHFVGHEESGTGSESELSDQGESETDGEQDEECPDCGGRVRHGDSNRKWEIKVFAANGLMRAGAWAAAWKEMEKVDVEVGLWLPSEVRRSLEKILAEENAANAIAELHVSSLIDPTSHFVMDPRQLSVQRHARTVSDAGSFQASVSASAPLPNMPEMNFSQTGVEKKEHEVALQTLLINYIRVLASDRRNIALVFMSILAVFLAIGARSQELLVQPSFYPFPPEMAESPVIQTTINAPSPSIVSSSTAMVKSLETPVEFSSIPVSEAFIPTSVEKVPMSSILGGREIEPVEFTGATVTTENAEPTETAEPTEVVEPTETAEFNETAKSADSTESIEPAETAETIEPGVPTTEIADPIETEVQPIEPEAETESASEPEATFETTNEKVDIPAMDKFEDHHNELEPLDEPNEEEL
ncbi:hypothetical protein N7448_007441 [Penicillium atrosanguineum]|uniref:Uncharacterized protein n=1 Tax=Penicillium atrosanguineum TaxID=1132637 RepID=A0A9W9KY23_9EURO|nr:hypothetical protein N7448_007441 [Penicillium atrosanguineum]KAJ5331819.1 hypothetical protein N7476_001602 [Penicillium atrosanguineum]